VAYLVALNASLTAAARALRAVTENVAGLRAAVADLGVLWTLGALAACVGLEEETRLPMRL
jgi:hypothetical protein